MLNAIWGLFAAAILVGLTAWFQHGSWRNQDFVRLLDREREAALAAATELSALIGRRLYRQKRYLWAIREGRIGEAEPDAQEYRKILFEWNDKLGEIQTRLAYSFGSEFMMKIECDIQPQFSESHRLIVQVRNDRKLIGSLWEVERNLNVLGSEAILLNRELLEKIRSMDFSVFPERYHISFQNRRNLSNSYLFLRLFGLAKKGH